KHLVRLVGYADVISFGFAHFLFAVQADKDGRSDYNLWRLSIRPLDIPANEIVESLVCAAQFDVTLYDDRIITLYKWVQEFVHKNIFVGAEALFEAVSPQQIEKNAKTYLQQAAKILDTSKEKLEVCHNSE
ncbi:unnamed protein product, partial [marine sediment metagenome]